MEKKQFKNFNPLKGIKVVEEGKRFESYIGWSFSKELKCKKYHQSVKYSLKEEKDIIVKLLNNNNIEYNEKDQIINTLDKYDKDLDDLKSIPSSDNNKSDSKSEKNKTSSDANNTQNLKNDLNINNTNTKTDNIINNDINQINKNDNVDNNNINNNINIINNNIIDNNIDNAKEIKKAKKKALIYKKAGDIYGDIDVIIPNVNKLSFNKMLEKNFFHKETHTCIIFDEKKLDNLPDKFHLLIEVGLNAFSSDMPHKIKQIRKYVSLINIRDNIKNERIKQLYIDDFANRLSLNINLKKEEICANTFVYMLISNSDYDTFTHRFLENRRSK